jgi:hypothetical protein
MLGRYVKSSFFQDPWDSPADKSPKNVPRGPLEPVAAVAPSHQVQRASYRYIKDSFFLDPWEHPVHQFDSPMSRHVRNKKQRW